MCSFLKLLNKYSHPSLFIYKNGTSVMNKKGYTQGYKTALAISKFQKFSDIYFEAQIKNGNGNVRIGFATKECELRGPLGMDSNGYSYGNKNGYGFHKSIRIRFGERYQKNDIISAYLCSENNIINIYFFVNGIKLEKYFENISDREYWPAVSIYGECQVNFKFKSDFKYKDKIIEEIKIFDNLLNDVKNLPNDVKNLPDIVKKFK